MNLRGVGYLRGLGFVATDPAPQPTGIGSQLLRAQQTQGSLTQPKPDTVIAPSVGTELSAAGAAGEAGAPILTAIAAILRPLADVGSAVGTAYINKGVAKREGKNAITQAMIMQENLRRQQEFLLTQQGQFWAGVAPLAKVALGGAAVLGGIWLASRLLSGRAPRLLDNRKGRKAR